jgi:DNA-binding beta-propeller fold protein YncE
MSRSNTLAAIALVLFAASLNAAGPAAYVVNTLGETLSRIDLTTGQVRNNIVRLGSDVDCAPNQIIVRDTLAYVVNSLTDEIQIINLTRETTAGYIALPAGSNPYWMEFYNDRYAYVTLLVSDAVAKVDIEKRLYMGQTPVGMSPGQIVIHDHKAYIGITGLNDQYDYEQGKVAIYDCRGDSLLTSLNVGTNPNALAVDRQGRIHVCCVGDYTSVFGRVYVLNSNLDTVLDSLYLGGSPGSISIGPGNVAYLAAGGWTAAGQMYSYDAQTLQVFHSAANPHAVSRGCIAVGTFQDSTVYAVGFADSVCVTDSTGAVYHRYAVGDGPLHIAFNYEPGDIDGDWLVTMGDLTFLIDMLFISLQQPEWFKWRANVDGDFLITMGDLTVMIDALFIHPGAGSLRVGPTWLN